MRRCFSACLVLLLACTGQMAEARQADGTASCSVLSGIETLPIRNGRFASSAPAEPDDSLLSLLRHGPSSIELGANASEHERLTVRSILAGCSGDVDSMLITAAAWDEYMAADGPVDPFLRLTAHLQRQELLIRAHWISGNSAGLDAVSLSLLGLRSAVRSRDDGLHVSPGVLPSDLGGSIDIPLGIAHPLVDWLSARTGIATATLNGDREAFGRAVIALNAAIERIEAVYRREKRTSQTSDRPAGTYWRAAARLTVLDVWTAWFQREDWGVLPLPLAQLLLQPEVGDAAAIAAVDMIFVDADEIDARRQSHRLALSGAGRAARLYEEEIGFSDSPYLWVLGQCARIDIYEAAKERAHGLEDEHLAMQLDRQIRARRDLLTNFELECRH